jgi:DNA excision repair protein ERCC-4
MLYVDNCEVKSKIPELLKKYTNDITVQKLEIGDYVFGEGDDTSVIERKTTSDFLSSIYDGRLSAQAFNMKSSYNKRLFIVEGGFPVVYDRQTARKRASFVGALSKLYTKFGVSVIVTPDAEVTAMFIADSYLSSATKDNSKLAPVHKHGKSKVEITENILCQIPHVGRQNAINLLNKFGSIQGVVNATVTDLVTVDGIGKTRATVITDFLQDKYEAK